MVAGIRMLVAEDDPDLAKSMRLMMESDGYDVVLASSALEAAELLRIETVDIVLTDSFSRTPEAVLDSTRELRKAAGSTPVLLLTGHHLPVEKTSGMGFCAIVEKPFEIESLSSAVRCSLLPGSARA